MADKMVSLFRLSLSVYDTGLRVKEIANSIKFRKWRKLASNNTELKKYKQSDKCYICGNGPSLKKVNMDQLDGDTIVMNNHWKIGASFKMKPTYYLLADKAFSLPKWESNFEGMMNYCPETPHIMTVRMGPKMDSYHGDTKVYYFSPLSSTYKSGDSIDFTKNISNAFNVVGWAILLAIYLGYKEIYLLGCDYSLFASRYIQHAYDKNGEKVASPIPLRDMLFKYSITTEIHYQIAKYAKDIGVKIVNLTKDTVLDAYDVDENSPY